MFESWKAAHDAGIFVHQIFYSAETQALLDPYFIPLNNRANPRPDWFEFWVILDFLRNNELHDDAWYGFLSPNFGFKTGFSGRQIVEAIIRHRDAAEVAIPSYGAFQMSYFVNVFEQGEYWHRGMVGLSREFFARHNVLIDRLVSHTSNSYFSNYVIARAPFWRLWHQMAEDLWSLAEAPGSPYKTAMTEYRTNMVGLKVFVQERIGPALLATRRFRTLLLPAPRLQDVDSILFEDTPDQRAILRELDSLKQRFAVTGDRRLLQTFFRLRGGDPPPLLTE